MTIDVPDEWAARFELFDRIEAILRQHWQGERGASRADICTLFGSVSVVGRCWKDPAFLVLAGSKGISTSSDFYARWGKKA